MLGLWSVPGLLEAAQYYAGFLLQGQPARWGEALLRSLPKWYLWALLTPVILRFARRFPIERATWRRSLAVHVPMAVVVTAVHLVLTAAARPLLLPTDSPPFGLLVRAYFTTVFAVDFIAYWAILGAYHALEYHRRYRERELLASRLEASLAGARLEALRMQLHPHFLFNTLNAVSTLALAGAREETVRVLSLLAGLLRASLDRSDPVISLREELECLDPYLEIQTLRFQDRLQVVRDVHPEALAGQVPTFILQPLVENAIRHGIARTDGPGRVEIRAQRQDGRLRVEIVDSGPGPEPGSAPAQGTGGLGLRNARARLEQLYGSDFLLELADAGAGGTRVRLDIPFRPAPRAGRAAEAPEASSRSGGPPPGGA